MLLRCQLFYMCSASVLHPLYKCSNILCCISACGTMLHGMCEVQIMAHQT